MGRMPMSHRIEMNVIHVTLEIDVAANGVFPEASLPYWGDPVRNACGFDDIFGVAPYG
jgi:hypothetical protein